MFVTVSPVMQPPPQPTSNPNAVSFKQGQVTFLDLLQIKYIHVKIQSIKSSITNPKPKGSITIITMPLTAETNLFHQMAELLTNRCRDL